MTSSNITLEKHRLLKYSLILIWLALNIGNLQIGLADNGDWARLSTWFAPTPIGFETTWVDHTSPVYLSRYFTYWLPFWNINFSEQGLITSTILLLWMPGLMLNRIFFSPAILYLPWISLIPRLLVLIFLLGIFDWIQKNTNKKRIFYFTFGLPLVLISSSTDYIAYFNTFYQESAAFIGLLFVLMAIYSLRKTVSRYRLAFFILSLVFLTLSRSSLFYWPILTIPFALLSSKIHWKNYRFLFPMLLLSTILIWSSVNLSSNTSMREINNFNTIFTGILPFSKYPEEHLKNSNLIGSEICIDNIDYFSNARAWCSDQFQTQLTRKTSFQMIITEPTIIFRQFLFVTAQMQQLQLSGFDYPPFNLGNYSPGIDRYTWHTWLNIWSNIKSSFFPRGLNLIFTLTIFALIFIWSLKRNPLQSTTITHLAKLGLLLLVGLLFDMMLTINGDGKYEIVKHLFFSNLIFDLNLLLAVNLLILRFDQKK